MSSVVKLLCFITLVVYTQIEASAEKVDLVLANLIAQKAPGCTVMLERNCKTACKIAQS